MGVGSSARLREPFLFSCLRNAASLLCDRMESVHRYLVLVVLAGTLSGGGAAPRQSSVSIQERADQFLALVNAGYQGLYRVESEAQWLAATDVSPVHDAASETAG